jgi:type IV pilus assembly protein PilP
MGGDSVPRGSVIASDSSRTSAPPDGAGAAERRASRRSALLMSALPLAVGLFLACSSDAPPAAPSPFGAAPDAGAPPIPARGPAAVAAMPSSSAAMPKVEFQEDDFSETEHSRDPFRSFAKLFSEQGKTRVKSQRQVLLDRYAVDELKLIGLVTNTDIPRAMLVDPSGKGWVVTKGQFIGRSEVIHAAGPGGVDYEINWRIERIREGDLVLVREDPAHSDVPASTRVISLRVPESEVAPQ